ncbi:hypothetical protein GL50803_009900 [Giardia duodenalis]|uniref:Uncharacterized protein n=1 Tax=Giardia intestinalis (strain ATCC 50803 / WB clone C6) TaxID=184922 RepID=D3KHR4_GIAIC|nr:hypothetical protein GL50803_009900 [Giardia intestinalis]KAE8304099.1 hypothetical protein GL50803_009900 [Giardia intestinalis]
MINFVFRVYSGLRSFLQSVRLCTYVFLDSMANVFYPYMWSLDTRIRSLAHVPKHIFFTGGLNNHNASKRASHARRLSAILAAAIDGGVKLFTLYSSHELWHFEEINALLLSLTNELKRLGYTPFISLAVKTVDTQLFKSGAESTESDDESDGLLTPLNILLLSPAARPGNFSRADAIIQLLDIRNSHGSYISHLAQYAGKDFSYSNMVEGFHGLAMDTSGHFIGYPDLYLSFSKYQIPQVHNCMPWMLRCAMIFMCPPIRHYNVQSFWRDLVRYNRARQRRADITKNLD